MGDTKFGENLILHIFFLTYYSRFGKLCVSKWGGGCPAHMGAVLQLC